jgi:uncharacterized protein HemX
MNDSPDITPAAPPLERRSRFDPVAWGALLLAGAALALAAWSWFEGREQSHALQTELGRRLAEGGGEIKEARLLARNADDAVRQITERLGQVEAHIANAQQQQLSLEALYKDLSQGRDQWTLAEIEQVLLTAAQQLQLAGNVKAAIIALENADTRLQRLDKPQFAPLRRAIAADLAQLRATPAVDEIGISAQLEALVAQHARWPLASAQSSEAATAPRPARATSLGSELLEELKRLVQIRRLGENEAVLLAPQQAFFLRENLRLRLLSARLALLSRDQAGFHADLRSAEQLLSHYFNTEDAGVIAAVRELAQLQRLQIAVKLPEIKASLTALESFKAAN